MDLSSRKAEKYFQLADAIMDLQTRAAKSLIDAGKGTGGGDSAGVSQVRARLDRAIVLCDALLKDGGSGGSEALPPLISSSLRERLREIENTLVELQEVAGLRLQDPEASRSAEVRFDWLYRRLLEQAEGVEIEVEKRLMENQAESRRISLGVLIAWACVLAVAVVRLQAFEKRRKAAGDALFETITRLWRGSEELKSQREQLTESLEERTKDLKSVSSELQELVRSRRVAEEALRASEEHYRGLVETMADGLAMVDAAGLVTFANDSLCALLGRPRDEVLRRRFIDFAHSDRDWQLMVEHMYAAHRSGCDRFEVSFSKADGQEIRTRVSPKRICDAAGKAIGYIAVITDMSELAAIKARCVEAAHMASVGELAAVVAHEINNPANGIINYARMLCDRRGLADEEKELASRMVIESRRITDIVRRLLLFARGTTRAKSLVRVDEILANVLALAGPQMKADGIELVTSVPADCPRLLVDPQAVQQVFINILSNARYALNQKYSGHDAGKVLRIDMGRLEINGASYVRVTFHDSGVGIPADTLDKIAAPFFSTKPKGRGTGLGLSICKEILDEHRGRLSVESVAGEFTRVVIDLPIGG